MKIIPASEIASKEFYEKVLTGEYTLMGTNWKCFFHQWMIIIDYLALIDSYSSGASKLGLHELKSKECGIHTSRQAVSIDYDVMVHRRNSIFRLQIDKQLEISRSKRIIEVNSNLMINYCRLRRLFEAGMLQNIRAIHYTPACQIPPKRLGLKPFSINQVRNLERNKKGLKMNLFFIVTSSLLSVIFWFDSWFGEFDCRINSDNLYSRWKTTGHGYNHA